MLAGLPMNGSVPDDHASFYIVMWIVVPLAPEAPAALGGDTGAEGVAGAPSPSGWMASPAHRARRRSGGGSWVFGLILIGLGIYFLAREYLPAFDFDRLWPLGLVLLGVLLLFAAMRRRPA